MTLAILKSLKAWVADLLQRHWIPRDDYDKCKRDIERLYTERVEILQLNHQLEVIHNDYAAAQIAAPLLTRIDHPEYMSSFRLFTMHPPIRKQPSVLDIDVIQRQEKEIRLRRIVLTARVDEETIDHLNKYAVGGFRAHLIHNLSDMLSTKILN